MHTAKKQLLPSGYQFSLFIRPILDLRQRISHDQRHSQRGARNASSDNPLPASTPRVSQTLHEREMYDILRQAYNLPDLANGVYQTLNDSQNCPKEGTIYRL